MALSNTNLLIQMAQLPPTFRGTPQDLADTMVKRMRIVSPSGTNFIFVGDQEPSSNVGPWLRNGTQWWVFDEATKRYVPLDISESETTWFHIGATTPTTSDPPVWIRTEFTPTTVSPSPGRAFGWYVFDGSVWRPFGDIVNSGTTAQRPTNPLDLEMYYDTTISVLIWFERGSWRTISGVPGDIKFVGHTTLDDALLQNPGWSLLGSNNANLRGRYISGATKDQPGSGGTTDLTTAANVPHRAVGEIYGETQGLTGAVPLTIVYPPTVSYYALVKD